MNALKAFVVVISVLFFAATATAASVVTVSVVPGQGVGLADPGYIWAGIVRINIDGKEYWATSDFISTSIYVPTWYNDPTPREMNLYTRADILSGALVAFSSAPSQYNIASQFFIHGMLGINPQDNLWGAGFNEMVWKTMWSNTPWHYADMVYDQQTQVKLTDAYNALLPTLDPNYDFGPTVRVLFDPLNPDRELLVYMATPIPPAVWLFGFGLLGLVAVARRKAARRL